jgi:RNA polymerase sigma factor (sigma-70 family)
MSGRPVESESLRYEQAMPGGQRFDPTPWRAELLVFVSRMGAGSDTEDIVQQAMLRAIEHPPSSHARAWLYRIALNLVRMTRRWERRASAAAPKIARPAITADHTEAIDRRDLAERAWRLVEGLPHARRAALFLRLQRHMDYDEIALALDCSVASARQQFYLGLKAIRDALAEENDG